MREIVMNDRYQSASWEVAGVVPIVEREGPAVVGRYGSACVGTRRHCGGSSSNGTGSQHGGSRNPRDGSLLANGSISCPSGGRRAEAKGQPLSPTESGSGK